MHLQPQPRVFRPLLLLSRGPLQRPVDRVEAVALTGLLTAFAVVAPLLAALAGAHADTIAVREERAEAAWRPVSVTLTESAAQGLIDTNGAWGVSWVTAQWTAPDGATRTGQIAVPLNARAGDRVQVWETGKGQLTHEPLTHAGVIDRVMFAAFWVIVWVSGVFAAVFFGVREVARRLRMAGWARDWAAFGSRWSQLR